MKLLRLAGTVALSLSLLLWAGCGSTFRPVVNPVLPPGPSPQTQTFGLVLNQDPSGSNGAAAEIDLTGDAGIWNQRVAVAPVHAGILGLQAFVANQTSGTVNSFTLGSSQPAVNNLPVGANPTFVLPVSTSSSTGSITAVSVNTAGTGYTPGDKLTITQSNASGGVVRVESVSFNGTVSTSTGAVGPVVAVSIDAVGSGYTVQSGLATTPITGSGTGALINITAVGGTGKVYVANFSDNTVSVIDATLSPPQVVATPTVGTGPIAMAASKDGSKVYVANRDSANVSVIATVSNTVTGTSPISLPGTQPVAVVTNTDSGLVYVYSANDGKVYVIDPTTDTNIATATATATPLASGPCLTAIPDTTTPVTVCQPMAFDSRSQRLYVADGSSTVSVFNTSVTSPTPPTPVFPAIPALSGPSMVAPLPDGMKAYVLNTGIASTSPGQVSVINTANNSVKTVNVGATPVAIAVSADSTRVVVAHQGAGVNTSGTLVQPAVAGTTIITTANDTVVTDLSAPPIDPNCTSSCPVMNPVAVITSH